MSSMSFTGLINNVALLLAMGVIYGSVTTRLSSSQRSWSLLSGFFLGVIGIGLMMSPWQLTPGVVFDARSILLSVGGLFMGLIPATVAVIMTCLYRLYEGGIGAMTGSAVIITSGFLGVIWGHLRKRRAHHLSVWEYYLFGVAVHVSMLLWMLSLPHPIGITVLKKISLPVMLIFPVGTILFAKLIAGMKQQLDDKKALKESENRYRALVEQSLTGIYAFDETHFLYVNQRFAEIFGYTESELINKLRPTDIVDEEDREIVMNQISSRASRKTDASHYTVRGRRKDGTRIWIEIHGGSMDLDDKTIMTGTLLDITDRRRAEERLRDSESRYSSLIEEMSSGFALHEIICAKDGTAKDYRFLEVNRAFEEITGLNRLKVIGKTVLEAVPETEDIWLKRFGEVALTGEPQSFANYSKGLGKHYEVTAYCPKPGQFATIINDISDRKLAEEEVHRLNNELEERVKQRTAQLELSNQELEKFSYSVSHDLRAPLRAINGQAGMLEEAIQTDKPVDISRALASIRRSSSQMGQLVDDLLAYSRLSRVDISLEPVDIKALATECWEQISSAAPQRNIDFRLGNLPPAQGNKVIIRQLLFNLLDNAAKYSTPREQTVVEVGSMGQNGETVYFVRDNGVGFDMRYVDKLFGVFHRLHLEEEFEGTGIGLALAKRIVERHGGRLWAEGKIDQGATFYFTLQSTNSISPEG